MQNIFFSFIMSLKLSFSQIKFSKIEHCGTRSGSTTAQWQNVITPKPNVCHLPHCYSYDTNGFSTHWSCVRYYSLLMVSGIQTHCICNLTGYRGWLSDQINYQSLSSLLCMYDLSILVRIKATSFNALLAVVRIKKQDPWFDPKSVRRCNDIDHLM